MKKTFKSASLYNVPEFYVSSLIDRAIQKHGITIADLARVIGVGVMTLRDWQSGKSAPKFTAVFTLSAVVEADVIEGLK